MLLASIAKDRYVARRHARREPFRGSAAGQAGLIIPARPNAARAGTAGNVESARQIRTRAAGLALTGRGRDLPMISVAAIRMQQFGVQFYQASLTRQRHRQARPVRGAELRRAGAAGARQAAEGAAAPSKVNWDLLERRIASSEKAYQRQIIRKKIDELVQYYEQCRQARDLPSIPGAVIISCDETLRFEPVEPGATRRHA